MSVRVVKITIEVEGEIENTDTHIWFNDVPFRVVTNGVEGNTFQVVSTFDDTEVSELVFVQVVREE